ncbi:MAG: phytanoyl-CoA dioxygenase family protein [Planctomycetes bacterium]|nr:phytanoyl-CoA dioxygenase family protein [Planctomycetota bacterium]
MPNTTLRFWNQDLELGGDYLGELRESQADADVGELRARMDEDGYLFIRGLHHRDDVLAARRELLDRLHSAKALDPYASLMDGIIGPAGQPSWMEAFHRGEGATKGPAFLALVEGRPVMDFFARFFDRPVLTFDFKWLRVVGRGEFTSAHLDNVYMGRGSPNLHSVWTPIGDTSMDMGALALIPGSHRLESYARVRETYGRMDVDRDNVDGAFTDTPTELIDRFGGRWATADFRAGDALIFSMFTMHGSLTNTTDRFRISCDTRYQPSDEPVDERWVGEKPKAHYAWRQTPSVPMGEARKRWGV